MAGRLVCLRCYPGTGPHPFFVSGSKGSSSGGVVRGRDCRLPGRRRLRPRWVWHSMPRSADLREIFPPNETRRKGRPFPSVVLLFSRGQWKLTPRADGRIARGRGRDVWPPRFVTVPTKPMRGLSFRQECASSEPITHLPKEQAIVFTRQGVSSSSSIAGGHSK